jgi:TonB family protein
VDDIRKRQDEVRVQLEHSRQHLSALEERQREIDAGLSALQRDQPRYEALGGVVSSLERVAEVDAEELLWGELAEDPRLREQLSKVQDRLTGYADELDELNRARETVCYEIETVRGDILEFEELIHTLLEIEEQAKDDFVIEREHDHPVYRKPVMPWTKHDDDEKRYRRILLIVLCLAILLGYLVPLWTIPEPPREAKIEVPERLAKLLQEKKPPPPPPPKQEEIEEEKPEEPEKEVEKKPEPEEKPQPVEKKPVDQKKIQSAGVLAFKNDFASLLDLDPAIDEKIGAKTGLRNKGQTAKQSSRSIITTAAAAGSAGINTASLSRNVGGSGSSIEGVEFSRVESSIGTEYATEDRPLSEGLGPSRTDEEIQIIFDKYKSALYRIYNRELRKNPTLQGRMVLRLTIEPDGSVSACSVDSSDMDSPDMNTKIVARVKRFNFGPKEGVPTITILFPVDFLPAN